MLVRDNQKMNSPQNECLNREIYELRRPLGRCMKCTWRALAQSTSWAKAQLNEYFAPCPEGQGN